MVRAHVRRKPKYKCVECMNVSYCTDCSEDSMAETPFICKDCVITHPGAHNIHRKVPENAKAKVVMLQITDEVNDIEADIANQLGELKETIWRVEKAYKNRIVTVRDLLEEAEQETVKHGAVNAETRSQLLKAAEEAKARGRLLLARLKLIDENAQNVFASNGGDLTYEGAVPLRDALRLEILKQKRLGNHVAMMEAISEFLEASNGRVTLREMHLLSRVVLDRLEVIGTSTKRMHKYGSEPRVDENANQPGDSPLTLIRSMISGVAGDFRAECAELLDALTRIHAHADVNVKQHVAKSFGGKIEPSIDYVIGLKYENFGKEKRRNLSLQKFSDLQVILSRYLLALHVCAVWLSLIDNNKEEKADVRQQLRDCIDGYMYAAKGGPFTSGEAIFTNFASTLTELATKYAQFKGVKAVRRRVDKILNNYSSTRAQQAFFGSPSPRTRRAASLRVASNQLWHSISEEEHAISD
ncbi:unnamed protein product, partial [Mesorhabditis spiculigera]